MPPFIELSGKNVRNIKQYSIIPSLKTNIIMGKNGAGKTSLLEAIYLNTLGRSFRASTTRSLISDSETTCWVFAKHQNNQGDIDRIGIEHLKGKQQGLSINGKHHSSLAELAALIPTIIIQPTESQLIDGISQYRRKYLDWVLFHVEPQFLNNWRDNQKLLKQRNQLLRRLSLKRNHNDIDLTELRAWDQGYIQSCQTLSNYRKNINIELEKKTSLIISNIPALNNEQKSKINLGFYRGWADEKELADQLNEHLNQDLKKGFSSLGAHRCDLVIRENNKPAKDHLSRGQKKLLSVSMCIAQASVLKAKSNKSTILLLDDVFSEIDEENTQAIIIELEKLDTQLFISCLHTQQWVQKLFSKNTQVFHVEHGRIE